MQISRKQFSFPQFRIPWHESETYEDLERKRGKPYTRASQEVLLAYGFPPQLSQVDYGTFGGYTIDHDVMTNGSDISKGIIFRRNIKSGLLFAKTLTLPLGQPNLEYDWKLDKPIQYPDAIGQHQYLTKKFTRNLGLFDIRDYARDELCEDIQESRDQVISANCLVSFSCSSSLRHYVVHPMGPDLDKLVIKSVTFAAKQDYPDSDDTCSTCELPYDIPEIELVQEVQLESRIRSVQYCRVEGRDFIASRTDYRLYIFEADPRNSDEPLKKLLEGSFPKEILSTDLSPHLVSESAVLLREGTLYVLSKHGSSRTELPEGYVWISVVFGPHPRHVVCANEKSVYACEVQRGVLSTCNKLYKLKQERIVALTRHPGTPYLFLLASQTTVFLLDVRQPGTAYISICPELTGPIEMLTVLQLDNTPDRIRVLVNNRDGEMRFFTLKGGMGRSPEEPPNPPSLCEMVLQSDRIDATLCFMAPDIYFSCRKRFEPDTTGSTLFLLPSHSTDLLHIVALTMTIYGDIAWQQLIQTNTTKHEFPVLIKPTNEVFHATLNWMKSAKEQFYENFNTGEIYFDYLIESIEYFHANKILDWLLNHDTVCYTCYESQLEYNTKNFPSLSRLYFESGWTKYSNWSPCQAENTIPMLEYTRISFSEKQPEKLGKRSKKTNFMKFRNQKQKPKGCTCSISLEDIIDNEDELFILPWEGMDTGTEGCSDLFTNLWNSWDSEGSEGGQGTRVSFVKRKSHKRLEAIEEIEYGAEGGEGLVLGDTHGEKEFIDPKQNRNTEEALRMEEVVPFPQKGARPVREPNPTHLDTSVPCGDQTAPDQGNVSSDLDMSMEWSQYTQSISGLPSMCQTPSGYLPYPYDPHYSLSVDIPSPPSKFGPVPSTQSTQFSLPNTQSTPQKHKRKIGF